MTKIQVLARWNMTPEERAIIESSWRREADVTFTEGRDLEPVRSALPDLDAVVGYCCAELLANAPKLRLIHVLGHGIDYLCRLGLRETLLKRNIAVARANASAIPIAEFVLMSMLALTRRLLKFHEALAYQGSGSRDLRVERMRGRIGGELYQSALGIVGFGTIGKEIAVRAKPFGMMIGAVSRRPEQIDRERYGIQFAASLNEIDAFLGRCDYVVLCLPGTPETEDLMNHRRFAAMKDGSYLINIARGTQVVDEALWDALRSGKLAGAALDVARAEHSSEYGGYPFPFPIHQYNVILTPHYAGSTREARIRALHAIGENLRRLAHGEPLLNLANLEDGF